jgi:malate synthase
LLNEIEDLFGLEKGVVKVIFEASNSRMALEIEHCLFELRSRVVGINLNFRAKFFDDLRYLNKKSSTILPSRNVISIEEDFTSFYNTIGAAAQLHKLLIWCGLGFNVTGNLFDANEDADVQAYENELHILSQKSFDAIQITHSGYAETVRDNMVANKKNPFAAVPVSAESLLNYKPAAIKLIDLRDHLRTAIEFVHAWEQGMASAFFSNRLEDISTFDIIRAQIRQWIVNGVETEAGDKINSRYVTMILLEELDKLKIHLEEEFDGNPTAEMRTILNTYTQAALKLEQILHDEKIPEFFNAVVPGQV